MHVYCAVVLVSKVGFDDRLIGGQSAKCSISGRELQIIVSSITPSHRAAMIRVLKFKV